MSLPVRDDSRQKLVGAIGGKMDVGTVDFDLNETTITINTKLSYIYCAQGITEQGKLVCTAPSGIVQNCMITFTRSDGTIAGDTLHYRLDGY